MATFTPRQKNWRWVADDSATAPTPLAAENAQPTLVSNTDIIHLRFTFAELGGKADTTVAVALQYSLNADMSSPTAFGAAPAHWNYADGVGTKGSAVSGTSQLSDDSSFGEYCESGSNSLSVAASALMEVDFAVVPTASVQSGTIYYFQCVQQGNALALDTSETYPTLTTAAAAYTLACTQGSYVDTGQTLGFQRSLIMPAVQGSYQLTGQPLALAHGYMLALAQGSYALTGQALLSLRTLMMVLAQGVYSLTGQIVGLIRGLTHPVAQGQYSLTGQAIGFVRGFMLLLAQAGYTLTGKNTILTYTHANGGGNGGGVNKKSINTDIRITSSSYPSIPEF